MQAMILNDTDAPIAEKRAAFDKVLAASPDDLLLRRAYADALLAIGEVDAAFTTLTDFEPSSLRKYDLAKTYARSANILAKAESDEKARDWAAKAAEAADAHNAGVDASLKIKALIEQAKAGEAASSEIPFVQAMLQAAAQSGMRTLEQSVHRMKFGGLAASWSLVASLASPDKPDPWEGIVDDSALRAFVLDRGPEPALLAGGHIGPPVVLQNSFSRVAPGIHCLSSNSAFWLSRRSSDAFIPAQFPKRAALTVFDRLRGGGAVFVGADGLLGARGLAGQTFGLKTNWPTGAAALARRAGAKVYGCHALWEGERIRIAVLPGPSSETFVDDAAWMTAFADWYGGILQDILT
jgi:hypothetical protein